MFLPKNYFNCERSNLIYLVNCQGCQEEYMGEMVCLVKDQINIYRHYIRQPQYQQLAVEEYLRTCGEEKLPMFPLFKILQETKSHRRSYDDYFIDRLKPPKAS